MIKAWQIMWGGAALLSLSTSYAVVLHYKRRFRELEEYKEFLEWCEVEEWDEMWDEGEEL